MPRTAACGAGRSSSTTSAEAACPRESALWSRPVSVDTDDQGSTLGKGLHDSRHSKAHLAKPLGVGDGVDFHDPAARDRETPNRERPPAVGQDHPSLNSGSDGFAAQAAEAPLQSRRNPRGSAHWSSHSPAICPAVRFKRFQVLIRAMLSATFLEDPYLPYPIVADMRRAPLAARTYSHEVCAPARNLAVSATSKAPSAVNATP